MIRSRTTSRAATLLIVLMSMPLLLAACLITAKHTMLRRTAERQNIDLRLADTLLQETDRLILDWLDSRSNDVVLRQTLYPATVIEDTILDTPSGTVHVRIQAWDQCGMTTPLRPAADSPDMRVQIPDDGTRFPRTTMDLDAAGAWMRTHLTIPPIINVNTAPALLIRAAFQVAGRADAERIIAERRAGRRTTIRHLFDAAATIRIILSDRSTIWSIRTDIHVNGIRRSWWSVYRHRGTWSCVQRMLIHEPS